MIAFIKRGILKPRIVLNEVGNPHFYVFLIKDNKETLPPKELVESQSVQERGEDGKTWIRLEPWYRFEGSVDKVKGYKIMEYLEFKVKNE